MIEKGQRKCRLPVDSPQRFSDAFRFVPVAPQDPGQFENGQPIRYLPQDIGEILGGDLFVDGLQLQGFVRTADGLPEPFKVGHEVRHRLPADLPDCTGLGHEGSGVPEGAGL